MSIRADIVGESITNSGTANTSTAINLGGGLVEDGLAYRTFVSGLSIGAAASLTDVPAFLFRGAGNDWQIGLVTITEGSPAVAQFSSIETSSQGGAPVAFDASSKLYLVNSAANINRNSYRPIAVAPTSIDITAEPNADYLADLSGLTAVTSFILKAPSVDDRVALYIGTGHDAHALVIKGDTGVSINGGPAATEWGRLFQPGEMVELRGTSATNWQVVRDGRIRIVSQTSLSAASSSVTTGEPASSWEKLDWTDVDHDPASIADVATNVFTIRRDGKYRLSGYGQMASPAVDSRFYIGVEKNGTPPLDSGTYMAAAHASHTGPLGVSGNSGLIDCVVGDVLTMVVWQNSGGVEPFTAQTFMRLQEDL